MYKINVNASFYQNNMKATKDSNIKVRFMLSQIQKQFIQSMYLPRGYRLALAGEVEEKRMRTPKRAGAEFQTEFNKKDDRKESSALEKKSQKKQDQKVKDQKQMASTKMIDENSKPSVIQNEPVIKGGKKEAIETKKLQKSLNSENKGKGLIEINHEKKMTILQIDKERYKLMRVTVPLKKESVQEQIQQSQQKVTQPKSDLPKVKIQHQSQMVPESKSQSLPPERKQFCLRLVSKLKSHKSSWPFRHPVDPITQGVPNYLSIIRQPMDLKTIERKLNTSRYEHISEVHGDINKIFLNSYKFNPKETNYYSLTIELENYYHELMKEIQNNPHALEAERCHRPLKSKISMKSQQDFSEEAGNKKIKLTQSMSQSVNLKEGTTSIQVNDQQIKEKEKVTEIGLKIHKSPVIKSKKSNQVDRKQLLRKISKLSSKALQRIVMAAFEDIEDDKTTFSLDFQKMPQEMISKIDAIVRSETEKTESERNNLADMEKWTALF